MKHESKVNPFLRNDRNTWLIVAAILSGCALGANAQVSITDSTSAPSGNILASQLTDLGPGVQDGGRDYMNNGGTVGQTFTVASTSSLQAITILGRGDSASYWGGSPSGPQPFTAGTLWGIQISSVNAITGALTPLDIESSTTYVPTGGGANFSGYITYNLANPVILFGGGEYAFNLIVNDGTVGQSWFGLAHGTGNATSSQYGMNSNTSTSSGTGPVDAYGAFAQADPNRYSYVFAAQGVAAVPEPTTLALVSLGGLALVAYRRRNA